MQFLLQLPSRPSSPVSSNSMAWPSSLYGGFDPADLNTEHSYSNPGFFLPVSYPDIVNEDPPPLSSQNIPIPPFFMCAYHSKLDGKSIFVEYIQILTLPPVGQICDENGNDILPDTLPLPHDSDNRSDDWTPYNFHLEFEVADFIFC
jgi:hypothetical protein